MFFFSLFLRAEQQQQQRNPTYQSREISQPPPLGSQGKEKQDFFLGGGFPFTAFADTRLEFVGKGRRGGEGCPKVFFPENAFLIFFSHEEFHIGPNLGFFRALTFFYRKQF